jgi:serine/threonine protein kinase
MRYCPKCKAEYSDDQAICPIDESPLLEQGAGPEQPADPLIGRTIADKYRVERLLGRGGMGAVYEGRHLLLDRSVAIKVLHQNMSADEKAASRFIREAKASAKIEHPNAVTIHDFGVLKDGSAYLVMEFIRGRSLRQILMQKKNLDTRQAADWIIQVCNVLEAAHQQGIIHRDLKPENVMLKESADGSLLVKVVDFGLAKLVTGEGGSGTNLTQPGEVLGTPHYMAPEYYEGEEVDKRADIYAIGVILYEMLSGDAPFGGTVQSIIGGHLFKEPAPLFKANPSVDMKLNDVVQEALKKKRDERIGSASEFAQKLKAALKDSLNGAVESANVAAAPISASGASGNLGARQTLAPAASAAESALADKLGKTGEIAGSSSTGNLEAGDPSSADIKRTTGKVNYNTVAMQYDASSGQPLIKGGKDSSGLEKLKQPSPTGPVVVAQKTSLLPQEELEAEFEEEPETILEIIYSLKRELIIGSILTTILALITIALIIHFTAGIKVKPVINMPAAKQNAAQ